MELKYKCWKKNKHLRLCKIYHKIMQWVDFSKKKANTKINERLSF